MSLVLQSVLAGVLVAACAALSTWRLLSVRQRLRVLDLLDRLPRARSAPWLVRLRQRTLAQLAGGCAGCGGAPTPGAAASRNQTPGALRR